MATEALSYNEKVKDTEKPSGDDTGKNEAPAGTSTRTLAPFAEIGSGVWALADFVGISPATIPARSATAMTPSTTDRT